MRYIWQWYTMMMIYYGGRSIMTTVQDLINRRNKLNKDACFDTALMPQEFSKTNSSNRCFALVIMIRWILTEREENILDLDAFCSIKTKENGDISFTQNDQLRINVPLDHVEIITQEKNKPSRKLPQETLIAKQLLHQETAMNIYNDVSQMYKIV